LFYIVSADEAQAVSKWFARLASVVNSAL